MSKFMNRPPPVINSTPANSTFVEKIMVGLDHAPAAFDLRGQLIGAGGANLHYIRNETGAIATLRGRGSLFIDPAIGTESPEPMHLYIEHARFEGLQSAKQLAKNLIETMQQELAHFQQTNPPVPAVQFTPQQAPPIQNAQAIASQQPLSQMSVPPPMLAVPPPPVAQSTVVDPNNGQTSIMQQQNFLHQNQPSLQQQTIIPQTVPIHLHQGNMVIQQVQPNNVKGSLVHFQAPPPTSVHLSQPPPNIQIQPQQIVLQQQQQPNYQYHIQQAPIQTTTAAADQNQVTMHFYQPQGIQQQQFTTQQTIRPPQLPQTQQYILQGNTAYMVPPPNMMGQPQNIIFQTTNPQAQSQMHLQTSAEQSGLCTSNTNATAASSTDDNAPIKEETSGSECNESPTKLEKSDTDNSANDPPPHPPLQLPQQLQQPPPLPQHQQQLQIRASMAVPPPMTCVQHIVGNTLITTSQPAQTQTHQIYGHPVSIQQIQAPQQQIHVSTQNGQHFLVNAQQWQPQQQFQQVSQNANIQSFQLTTTQPMRNPNNPNEIVMGNQTINAGGNLQPQQHILATTFNPHMPAPSMQLQLQPCTVATQQTIMSDGQAHIIEQQSQTPQPLPSHQMMMQPPLSSNFGTGPQQNPQGNSPQPVPPPLPMPDLHEQMRAGQKRKRDFDEDLRPQMPPRMGMGSNSGPYTNNNQRDMPQTANNSGVTVATSSCTGNISTSSSQDEQPAGNNNSENTINANGRPMDAHHHQISQLQQQQPPSNYGPESNRQQFYRSMPYDGPPQQQQPSSQQQMQGPRAGMRFHSNNNGRNDFYQPMRPPHMMSDNNFPMHRMNFGPPPPPPPPQQNQHHLYPRGPPQARYRGQW